ncbi:TniQ family protein [Coleofasciculus sp. FACHB-129]|uniref:TniQ family protein n=1 Tax=Cyanophyceae TaxID=3028117 RepID=UPI0016885B2C|nr:TniQ family protein [Coleofasciculus sp. FACHB-129]MBD1893721.1 TniQ family protein [Coleofasciculus sp. FACHB-129]
MLANGLTAYESWNLKKVCIPSRSRFYQLEPVGVGTPFVESLTGYIARLAEVHCVACGVLMERELAPLINKEYGGANLHRIYNYTAALNGSGVMAMDLVQALQKMTLRDDLRFLTLLTWRELFPSRNLLRSVRAWCPDCYQGWHKNKQAVYEPLLWLIDTVKVCPYHQRTLIFQCPYCHQKNIPLAWRSRPGFCSKCGEWLGSTLDPEPANSNALTKDELKQKIWITSAVGELIAATPYLISPLPSNTIAITLSMCVDKITQGNIAAFARQLHLPRNTVWLWCKGENLPSLETLVRICYALQVSIVDFLTQKVVKFCSANHLLTATPKTRLRAKSKPFEADRVQQYLEVILADSESTPSSMEEVARQLGCHRRTIYRHFPDFCRAISAKYVAYQKDGYAKAIEECCEEVRRIAVDLYNQGKYPNESLISNLVSKPGHFRDKKVRLALKEVHRELGL